MLLYWDEDADETITCLPILDILNLRSFRSDGYLGTFVLESDIETDIPAMAIIPVF